MISSIPTDRSSLLAQEYANPTRLKSRYKIYEYRTPQFDLPELTARLLHDVEGPIADIGCGHGRYVEALRADRPDRMVLALDISVGMLDGVSAARIVADATAIPLRSSSCGAALSMHVLYHCQDPRPGVAELARVLRPGGVAVIATNADADKRSLRRLIESSANRPFGANGFPLEYAERVANDHFAEVVREDFIGEIAVDRPEPVMDWVASMQLGRSRLVQQRVRAHIERAIAETGLYRFGTHAGLLICR